MRKYRLLDLCSKAGGCSKGYCLAGFDVYGVDIEPQPNYPYPFTQGDAIEYLCVNWMKFDAIHISPPCQTSTWSARRWVNSGKEYRHIDFRTLRMILEATGKPYVIENTPGAPLIHPILLNGRMFGLKTIRARLFESNVFLLKPTAYPKQGTVNNRDYFTVAGHGGNGGSKLSDWQDAMKIDWMSREEIRQAIPPAYTEFIGRQLIRYLEYNQVKAELAV